MAVSLQNYSVLSSDECIITECTIIKAPSQDQQYTNNLQTKNIFSTKENT